MFREPSANGFAQTPDSWVVLEKAGPTNRYVITRGNDVYRWVRAGYRVRFSNPNNAQGWSQTWWWWHNLKPNPVQWGTTPPRQEYDYQRFQPKGRGGGSSGGGSSGGGSSGGSSGGGSYQGGGSASELRAEIARLRSEINGLHASSTGLGSATSDRAREIAELKRQYQDEAADIHRKLVDLGRAGTDSSAAVADLHAKIDALAARVATTQAAAGGGGGGGFGLGEIGQLLPMIVIIMLLGVVAKR